MNNFQKIQNIIPDNVVLVAVSKTKSEKEILNIYNQGHRIFGENKVQELVIKQDNLPKDIDWHMIGHLQRNKVKLIAPFVKMIHSVDSLKLLKEINKRALQNNKSIDCLLELHIAKEESKFGLSHQDAIQLLESDDFNNLKNINIKGVMGMATFTNDKTQVFEEFQYLHKIFENLKLKFFIKNENFSELSMGMSDDYDEALKAGATIVRIGSLIFGKRN